MKKINCLFAASAALTILVFTSCSSVDSKAPLIPKDASFAIHLNTNSLSSKLSWDEIKKSNWFVELISGTQDSLAKKILDEPSSSGIETKEGLFVFAKKEGGGAGYAGFTGHIKDLIAFEAFNKQISKSEEVKTNKELKTISFGDRGIVSWNDKKFLYLVKSNGSPGFKMDSRATYDDPKEVDLVGIASRIFKYKNDSLLVDDSRFTTLIKDDGDVHFWSNAESISSDGSDFGLLSALKLEVYFRETVTAATLTFEKGKIAIHARTYSNKQMQELMKKYSGDPINTSYIKRIPSDNVIGLIAANYKPEGLKQFLKLGGLDGIVNSFLGEHNLTLDQVVAASKGDLLIAVTDVGLKKKMIRLGEEMDSLPINSPSAEVLLCMSVKDKAPFERLASVAKDLGKSGELPSDFTYKIQDDLFVAGTSSAILDQYLKGGNRDFAFLSRISGHPMGAYIDINKLMTTFNEQVSDTSVNTIYQASVNMWKDVIITGGEYKDGAILQDGEINLMDQNTNSLQQLNTYINKLASTRRKPF